MAVTINDVAKRAGVSHTTVSWVIHNDPRITQKTKDKVNRAIEELNYHPNYNARSLVKGKTDAIAVVASFFSTSFEFSILRGVEDALADCDKAYNVNLYSSSYRVDEVLNEILYGKRADAVILLSETPSNRVISEYNRLGVPLILVENYHDDLITVKSNSNHGSTLATDFLVERGRTKLGIIVEELHGDHIPGLSQVERLMGFKKVLESNGVPYIEDNTFYIKQFRMEAGRDIAKKIITNRMDIDGIFCAAGDKVALGLIDELKKAGVNVPEDISVIGFDDIDVADLVSPSLTTIRQDLYGIGNTAYKLAVRAINGEEIDQRHIEYNTDLIIRGSV